MRPTKRIFEQAEEQVHRAIEAAFTEGLIAGLDQAGRQIVALDRAIDRGVTDAEIRRSIKCQAAAITRKLGDAEMDTLVVDEYETEAEVAP